MATTIEQPTTALIEDLAWCLALSQAPVLRPMAQWAEEEIVLPNGPFEKERYLHSRHPVSKPFFDEIDSGRWSRIASTGPTQNGKTVMCYVIPTMYHLFEIVETVIVGLPSMDMANDKWQEDFLPMIMASRYRDLLPTKGEGSRGGQVKRGIRFLNGSVLRFMSAGGNDKQRSAYTSRVVAITEADGMDSSSETSREADKIEQIEARTRAFGRTGKRIYLECTVSVPTGRIWQEVKSGSDSRIVRPCPKCGEYVTPEREHLKGWQDAKSEEEASELSRFHCPACDDPWTESDRVNSSAKGVIIHGGQSIDKKGKVKGGHPKTQTFGFRWSAVDNPFVTSGDLGAEEWLAYRSRNRENAEKKMRQFVWSMPYESTDIELTPLDPIEVENRTFDLKKGIVPDDTVAIAVGCDTGKRDLHWTALAITKDGGGRIIEYGKQPVEADRLGIKKGLVAAFGKLADYFQEGWQTQSGKTMQPSQVWIDSGWHQHTDAVYEFCQLANETLGLGIGSELFRPMKGYGEGQRNTTKYITPTAKAKGVLYVGNQFHIAKVRRNGRFLPGVILVHVNSDNWKSELHQRLSMPSDEPIAITLHSAASFSEHSEFCQQLTAEIQVEKYVPGRGNLIVWDRIKRNNHWLDASYSATCAAEAILAFGIKKESAKKPLSLREMAKQNGA